MLKVVTVVDKVDTAIDRLAKGNAKYNTNIEHVILDVHPKRPDPVQLQRFEDNATDADIIDWQYFRTAEMLRQRYSWLLSTKQVLAHHNPYSITESDWNGYDAVIANNVSIHDELAKITNAPLFLIPNAVDSDFWKYNQDWEPNNRVLMVANRIESKKGIEPVAIACAELGLKFVLVGSVSDPSYMEGIMATGNVEFHQQISDEELRKLYYSSTIHVCNSKDNFESGTNPILEAMMTGVPVLTRKVGHVPELYNGENMVLLEGQPDDVKGITDKLQEMMFDKKKLHDMRDKAWQTAKVRNFERRAYMYQKLYRQVLYPEQRSVSVIVPIYDKPDVIRQTLDAVAKQTYKNIEIIVPNDGGFDFDAEGLVEEFAQYVNCPVRYIRTSTPDNDYGLARARNEAIIEATGEILVFCDQRIVMQPDAVETFVHNLKKGHWLYGNKGAKKEFVENFSCVYRSELIGAGMFNERINLYGGQSQEVRERVRSQGMKTEFIEDAVAKAVGKSSNRNRQRENIIKMKNRLAKMNEL